MTSDVFNQCVSALCKTPKIVIIDEIDYLLGDNKTIETLRDIHDKTNCSVIFVGMGLANKKLERHKYLFDRFSEIVIFETFKIADVKEIVKDLSEVSFTPNAIELLLKKQNRFRQIVQTINQAEKVAKENDLAEITAETLKVIL